MINQKEAKVNSQVGLGGKFNLGKQPIGLCEALQNQREREILGLVTLAVRSFGKNQEVYKRKIETSMRSLNKTKVTRNGEKKGASKERKVKRAAQSGSATVGGKDRN